jgi:hypothetical protein
MEIVSNMGVHCALKIPKGLCPHLYVPNLVVQTGDALYIFLVFP